MKTPTQAQAVDLATRAQTDLDALSSSGVRAGVAALGSTRAAVRKALAVSRTPEELRYHLIELLYQESGQKLATAIARTRTIAQLLGQVAVADESGT